MEVHPPIMSAKGKGPGAVSMLTVNPAKAPQEIVIGPIMADADPNCLPWSDSAIAAEFGPTKPWLNIKHIMHPMMAGRLAAPSNVSERAETPAAIIKASAQGNSFSGRWRLSKRALTWEPIIKLHALIAKSRP